MRSLIWQAVLNAKDDLLSLEPCETPRCLRFAVCMRCPVTTAAGRLRADKA